MKLFPFIVCIVLGFWAGYFLGLRGAKELVAVEEPHLSPESWSAVDAVSRENKVLKDKVAVLQGQLAGFETSQVHEAALLADEKNSFIKRKLKEFQGLFDLSPDQAAQIGELVWESQQFWSSVRAGTLSVKGDEVVNVDDKIKAVLTDQQLEIYEIHLEEKAHQQAAMTSTAIALKYPVTLMLSEDQKASVKQKLYTYFRADAHSDTREAVEKKVPAEYKGTDRAVIWAAMEVLDEEQFDALLQSLKE